MFKRKNILEFFLNQQKKLTELQLNDCNLSDKKKLTDNYFLRNQIKVNFEHKLEQINKKNSSQTSIIPHYILDPEFCTLFHLKQEQQENIQKEEMYCLFTSPLHEEWIETISIKYEDSMILRSGFFNQEYEIYDSILNGFDGMFIYCQGLDKYQIQLLTETAREYHFTLIFILHNKNELNTILDTDAPYFAVSGFKANNFDIDLTLFIQLANHIPKTANLMAWAPKLDDNKKKLLGNFGYKVVFEVC
jgi:hypothetical protein